MKKKWHTDHTRISAEKNKKRQGRRSWHGQWRIYKRKEPAEAMQEMAA